MAVLLGAWRTIDVNMLANKIQAVEELIAQGGNAGTRACLLCFARGIKALFLQARVVLY